MKKLFFFLYIIFCLCGCGKSEKYFHWSGEKEIDAEGGSSEWVPVLKNPRVFPDFKAIYISLYNSTGEQVYFEELADPDQHIKGEWYEITGKINSILVNFSSNSTQNTRSITIAFYDGIPGRSISIIQKPTD